MSDCLGITNINNLISKYLTNDETKTCYVLGLKYDDNKKKYYGAMSNLTRDNFEELEITGKTTAPNNKKYTRITDLNSANLLELNLKCSDKILAIIDIDGFNDGEKITDQNKDGFLKLFETPEILKDCSYYYSRNKKLPHFCFILDGLTREFINENIKTATDIFNFCKADLLTTNAWVKPNERIFNFENEELKTIHINDLKQLMKPTYLKKFLQKENEFNKRNIINETDETDRDTNDDEDNNGEEEEREQENDGMIQEKYNKFNYFIDNGFNKDYIIYDVNGYDNKYTHEDIVKIGFALKYEFKDDNKGLQLFLKIVEFYSSDYESKKGDWIERYNKDLKPKKGERNANIGTIYNTFKSKNINLYNSLKKSYNQMVNNNSILQDGYGDGSGVFSSVKDIYESLFYKNTKGIFEKGHFKLESPLCFCKKNNTELLFYSYKELVELTRDDIRFNKIFKVGIQEGGTLKTKNYSFVELWRDDTEKAKYSKLVFEPDLNKYENQYKDCYNLFTGFKNYDESVEPMKEDESYFLKLLKHLSSKEEQTYTILLDYFSSIIQKPYIKTDTVIIFYSENGGVGKDTVIVGGKNIIGDEYYGVLNSIEDINKSFNSHLTNKLIIHGEEITSNAKKNYDKLKNWTTRKTCNLEKKGVDTIIVNDYSSTLVSTNNKLSFKTEKNDRRQYFVECNEERKDNNFFKLVYEEINNPYKLKQLFMFFKTRVIINEFIGNKSFLDTKYKQELTYESKEGYIQFLYKDNYINYSMKSNELYEMSKKWCNNNYLSSNYSIKMFGNIASEIFKDLKKKSNGLMIYDFEKLKGNQNKLNRLLYNYDKKYYRYVNGLDDDFVFEDDKKVEIIEEINNNDNNEELVC